MKMFMTIVFFILSGQAFAAPECDYTFNLSNVTAEVKDSNQVIQQGFTIFRAKGLEGKCSSYRMFFNKGQASSYQRKAFSSTTNTSINYNLHQNINAAGILKDFNDALSSAEFLSSNMPDTNTSYGNNIFVSIPSIESQNYPLAGVYTDNVQLSVYGYKPNNDSYTFESVSTLTITIVVNKKIDISIVDEGAPYNASATSKIIDFGLLELNAERGADLRIVTNTPYQVKLSSLNNGKLKQSSSTIAYQMKANGAALNLANSSGTPVAIGNGQNTSSSGDLYNLKIKISEDVENKNSGLYQDIITITAIAN